MAQTLRVPGCGQACSRFAGVKRTPVRVRAALSRPGHTHQAAPMFKVLPQTAAPAVCARSGQEEVARDCSANGASRWSGSFGVDWKDRVIGLLPYLLPFINAYAYGRYLFYEYPMFAAMVAPFIPLLQLYHSIPFASLICFFGVYIGMVANNGLSRFVRLNAMQAILLDIILIIPRLVEQLLGRPSEAFTQFYIMFNSVIWLMIAGACVYAVYSCVVGQTAKLPFISDAADQQLR